MRNYLKVILNILLPIESFKKIFKSSFFCKHDMSYYDSKIVITDTDNHLYDKINGHIWKNHLCYCKKCGLKKTRLMKVGDFGKWKNYDFEIPKNGNIVEIEIVPFGSETKRQKRDRMIRNILD